MSLLLNRKKSVQSQNRQAAQPSRQKAQTLEQRDFKSLAPGVYEVARRAYEIWETSGRPEGQGLKHWLEAERELGITRQ